MSWHRSLYTGLYWDCCKLPPEFCLARPPGGPYSIDIIDRRQMTITEVQGRFKGVSGVESPDKWWKWQGMVKIRLPSTPYIALKVTNERSDGRGVEAMCQIET